MAMDVRRMLALAEVARTGSLTATAKNFNLTVSAVSQQIRQLELEAGQALIERRARGATLTEAGWAVAKHAERVERVLASAHEEIRELSELRSGRLKLGTVPTVTESFLPIAISRFRAEHPDIELSIHSAQQSDLSRMLESREVELAITWESAAGESRRDHNIQTRPILKDPSMLLAPAGNPLASRSSVQMSQLRNERWIIRTSPSVLHVLTQACKTADFEPIVSFEARSYQEVQAMVAIGMGIALVPRLSLYSLRDDVRAMDITPVSPARRIVLAHRRGDRLSPAAAEMSRTLAETGLAWRPVPQRF